MSDENGKEIGNLEGQVGIILTTLGRVESTMEKVVVQTTKTNGRVTSNEKAVEALTQAISTLSKREDENSTWRKNLIFAFASVGTLGVILTGITIPLLISKAKNDVHEIVESEAIKLQEQIDLEIQVKIETAIENLFDPE